MNRGGETPWPNLGEAKAQDFGHEKQRGFFLHALEDERNSFCTFTMKKIDEGKPVM
jgi:hypothetical protein